jgi:poly(glycerol-phosphate) alpha-glucosyltransferase
MVILEAWAHGKPVLMTPECNLPEGFAANAAIRIEPSTGSIAEGLEELFRLSSSDLSSLGSNGRKLVRERFTWDIVGSQLRNVSAWLVGGGARPECVV